jgi:hypothetical protein
VVPVRKLGLLVLAVAAATFSCTLPPFNLLISQGVQSSSRMNLEGRIGPLSSFNFASGTGGALIAFYPLKDAVYGFTLQSGFITWSSESGSRQIAFVASNTGNLRQVASSQGLGMDTPDPPYPGFVIQSVKGGYFNIVLGWDASMTSRFKMALMSGDPFGNTYPPPSWGDMSPTFTAFIPPSYVRVRHMGVYPDTNVTYDRVYALVENAMTGLFEEAQLDLSSAGLSPPARLRLNGINLSGVGPTGIPQHALYYYDPGTTYGFANWWDSAAGKWITWRWYETTSGSTIAVASELPQVTRRIDALLTTRELFSTEDGSGRIYDLDGNLKASFPVAGLSFVGEVYASGVAKLLFSHAFWYQRQLYFNVFSIPSADVKTLAQ